MKMLLDIDENGKCRKRKERKHLYQSKESETYVSSLKHTFFFSVKYNNYPSSHEIPVVQSENKLVPQIFSRNLMKI